MTQGQSKESIEISERTMGWLSFATLFVIGTDTFLTAPLLPLLRREFGASLEQSGWLVSAYALGYAALALVAGPLSDRRDRRTVLLTGLAFFTVFTAASGLSWNFASMFGFRLLAGAAASFVTPQIWASIPSVVAPGAIIATMGRATAGLAIAQVAGIPLGSFLSTLGWRTPLFTVSIAGAALWITLATTFPQVTPAGAVNASMFSPYRHVLHSRPLMASLLAYFVFQCGNFCALSFIGTWLAKDFHADQRTIGIAMMVIGLGNALGSFNGSAVAGRLGTQRCLGWGIAMMGLAYAATGWVDTLWLAVGALLAAMAVAGVLFPVLMGEQQSHTDLARGTVSSVSNAAMYLGVTVGGIVGGPLLSAQPGYRGIAGFTVAMFMVALAIYWFAGTLRRPESEKR